MPIITQTDLEKGIATQVAITVLDGTDTLTFQGDQRLTFENGSGGAITANLLGAGVTGTKKCQGGGEVDLSTGYDITVNDGEAMSINLNDIRDYLGAQGNTVTITNGAVLLASLVV